MWLHIRGSGKKPPNSKKVVRDAREALEKNETAEDVLEKSVVDWTSTNRRFIRGKKKKKTQQVAEKTVGGVSGRWLETIDNQIQPEGTLKNDGLLTNMKNFKKQWLTYTGYLKHQGFQMDSCLYADMLLNRCDSSMR